MTLRTTTTYHNNQELYYSAGIKPLVLSDRREAHYPSLVEEAGSRYPHFDRLSIRMGLHVAFTCDLLQRILSTQFAKYGCS